MKKLALFDFDGTITSHDSFRDFLLFAAGKGRFMIGMIILSPWIILYLLKIIPNWKAKQKVMSWFFAGMKNEELEKIAMSFATEKLPQIIKKSSLKKLQWHLAEGHRVIVVSASIEKYLKYWCENIGIEIIGTRLEVKNNYLTGKFHGKNCWGAEKVNRIKEHLNLQDYEYIYAYGDSKGDKEMLAIADEAGFRNFQ